VTSSFRKVPFLPSTWKHETRFKNFQSGEHFRKVAFSVTVFTGYVWAEAQSAKKKSHWNENGYAWTGPGLLSKLPREVSHAEKRAPVSDKWITWKSVRADERIEVFIAGVPSSLAPSPPLFLPRSRSWPLPCLRLLRTLLSTESKLTAPSEEILLIGVNLETQFKDEVLGKAGGDELKNILVTLCSVDYNLWWKTSCYMTTLRRHTRHP